MLALFEKGGILMYFILLSSIMGLAVVIDRLIYFIMVENGNYGTLKNEVLTYIKDNDLDGAREVLAENKHSVARILEAILEDTTSSREILEEKVREVALAQIPILERYMWILGITAHVSPLLGLLGTVTGMIKAFNVIATHGVGNPEMLATGISEALITTAAGLTVAIPATVLHNYLNKKIDNVINEMEKASVEFLNILGKVSR